MKKIFLTLLAACSLPCALLTGCNKKTGGEEILTRPVVRFEETSDPGLIRASITSDFDLRSVVVEKYFANNDPNNETVATITSFSDPKSYVYEQSFTVPSGYLSMDIRVTAENVRGLSTTVSKTLQGEVTISLSDVVDAMAAAYAVWSQTGEMPAEAAINGFTFTKDEYMEYACRTFINIYEGKTDNPAIVGFGSSELPGGRDSFANEEISKDMLYNAATRMVNYGAANGLWPNYVGYGTSSTVVYQDPDGTTYQGEFGFDRSVVCIARALGHYKSNAALPDKISSDYRDIPPYEPQTVGTFTRTQIVDALAEAYGVWETGGLMPENVTIGTTELNAVQYFHAALKALLNIKEDNTADIEVLTYLLPENPGRDSYDREQIAVFNGPANGAHTEDLANIAQRMIDYATTVATGNGYFANYSGYVRGEGVDEVTVEFSWNRALVCFARALAAFKTGGAMPAEVSTDYLPPTTIAAFAAEFVKVLEVWEASGTAGEREIPADHTIEVDGVSYGKPLFFEAAARSLIALNGGAALSATLPGLSSYGWSEDPYREWLTDPGDATFGQAEAGLDLLANFAARQITYAGNNRVFANYCGYTSNQVPGYTGVCCLERGVLMLARMYKYMLDNNITGDIGTALGDVTFDTTLY